VDYQDYEITFEDLSKRPYTRPLNDLKIALRALDGELARPSEKLMDYQTDYNEDLEEPIVSQLSIANSSRNLIRTHVEVQYVKDRMIIAYRECINRMLTILEPLFSDEEESEDKEGEVAPKPKTLQGAKKEAKKQALSGKLTARDLFINPVEEDKNEDDAKENEET